MSATSLGPESKLLLLLASDLTARPQDAKAPRRITSETWFHWDAAARRSEHGDLVKLFSVGTPRDWQSILGLDAASSEWIERRLAQSARLAFALEEIGAEGVSITTIVEPSYPRRLLQALKRDAPAYLFLAGNPENLQRRSVAVVGSREPDEAAQTFTSDLVAKLVGDGYGIVSGGAKGIDRIAQETALARGGTCVVFLAEGILAPIRRAETRRQLLDGRLTFLSEVHPRSRWFTSTAMARNRLIHALGRFAVIVSSGDGEGGTWAGAVQNLKSQWSPVLIRIEDKAPAGNLALVKAGGIPLPREALAASEDIGAWARSQARSSVPLPEAAPASEPRHAGKQLQLQPDEGDVFELVWTRIVETAPRARSVQELARHLGLREAQLQEWLTRAEDLGRLAFDAETGRWRVLDFQPPRHKNLRLDRFINDR